MKLRKFLPLALSASFAAAHAQISVVNVNATYTLNPGAITQSWIPFVDGSAMTVDFLGNAPEFKVGDSTGFSTGTSSITYDVTATTAITAVDLVLQGDVEGFGEVAFTEGVSNGSGSLGSLSGSILGGSYSGGADGAFSKVLHLNFSQAVTSFSVTQTLASDVNGQSLPSSSIALVGTVEQNFTAVPEPASVACVGLGVLALVRRRRKQA